MARNFQVPYKVSNFLPSLAIISFLRRTLFPGISHTVVTQCQSAFITAKVFHTLSPAKQCTATYISWLGSTKARTGETGERKSLRHPSG